MTFFARLLIALSALLIVPLGLLSRDDPPFQESKGHPHVGDGKGRHQTQLSRFAKSTTAPPDPFRQATEKRLRKYGRSAAAS
jgi:hypothetical protein